MPSPYMKTYLAREQEHLEKSTLIKRVLSKLPEAVEVDSATCFLRKTPEVWITIKGQHTQLLQLLPPVPLVLLRGTFVQIDRWDIYADPTEWENTSNWWKDARMYENSSVYLDWHYDLSRGTDCRLRWHTDIDEIDVRVQLEDFKGFAWDHRVLRTSHYEGREHILDHVYVAMMARNLQPVSPMITGGRGEIGHPQFGWVTWNDMAYELPEELGPIDQEVIRFDQNGYVPKPGSPAARL